LFTDRFEAARTAWTEGDEAAAADCLRAALFAARGDPTLRRELASALYNLGRLTRKRGSAGETEAESLITEALAISEELYGGEDAALAPIIQELSRLYVQQSEHARAAEALERLLRIARVKGDAQPEVAAALADLAFVKRKLGDDDSAETLYRDALRLREQILEPNHALTIGTMERLAETCAARGNFAEALALLRRVLPAREAALGAGHERVRAARSRITELELQVAKAAAPAPAVEPPVPSAAPRPRDRAKTPAVAAAVAASIIASSVPTPATSQITISALQSASRSGSPDGREPGAVQRDLVVENSAATSSVDVGAAEARLGDTRSTAPSSRRKRRTTLYAAAGVGVAGIAMAALLMSRPRGAADKQPRGSAAMSAGQRTDDTPLVTAPPAKTVAATGSGAMAAAMRVDSPSVAGATSAAAATVQQEQAAPKSVSPEFRAPRVEIRLDSIALPTIPAAPTGEAILESSSGRQRVSDTNRIETKAAPSLLPPTDVDVAHTSPKVIGRAPDPGFPDALLRAGRREGQVVVRFIVNELGRVDVPSMVVEHSDDELFTSAVRDVLPYFRFEPARTLGSESKPVPVWVSVPFRFTTKKR
jgi:TonB family protein